ncbi:hypothetical protein MRX96_003672 [Rhipicephalus microplus]
MTHTTGVSNGASLEDCHTNFFALADLCGLKWRRLSTEHPSPGGAEPLSEPVLWSFAKCLAADLLCVWRRVARPEHQHRRELWLFWYGEEPDLSGLVSPELSVARLSSLSQPGLPEGGELVLFGVSLLSAIRARFGRVVALATGPIAEQQRSSSAGNTTGKGGRDVALSPCCGGGRGVVESRRQVVQQVRSLGPPPPVLDVSSRDAAALEGQ